jgi:glycosidase
MILLKLLIDLRATLLEGHILLKPMCSFFCIWCWRIMVLLTVGLGLLAAKLHAQTTNLFWQRQNIYQIITDRFYDGNTNNDNAEGTYAPNNPTGVHGGDFAGIEQKLDYIKALGATAIWISPIVLNTEGQFHGYSAWNFYEVAPHWGSITDLQNLVRAAHARGLLVIDDIVVNHAGDLVRSSGSSFNYPTGYTLTYWNSSKTYPPPFNLSTANPSLTNIFHNYGDIQNFNDPTQVQLGWLDGLNDFRTETPYIRTNMAAIYEYWINQIGFDGFRVDTALEVDMGFWQYFCPAIHAYAAAGGDTNFFMFGEADTGSETTVASYTGTEDGGPFEFDSVVDYPLYDNVIQSVFATATGATFLIQNHYNAVDTYYDPVSRRQLVTFLDNHDNPRFLSTSEADGDTNRLKVALVFLYTSCGIPCLYYGTEQGFDGTTDPNDREDMFAGEFKDGPDGTVESLSSPGVDNFNMTHPLFQWVAKLNNFRRLYPALTLGSYINRASNSSGPGLFAYSRILGTQEVFVVFNTASSSQTLTACTLTYPAGTVLLNLLNTNENYTLTAGSQTPAITVPGTTAKIFIAQSQWQPLDPVVVSNSPSHWSTNATSSPIVLQFSESMDTNSVQAAFRTAPAVSGSFSWSSVNAANDTMTFTPNGAGFPPLTNITVIVTNSAYGAASGKTMFAPYELTFLTTIGPQISITSPTNSANFITGSNITITATASESGSGTLTNVAYYANATPIGNATSAPYNLTWPDAPAGSYALTAVASDSMGNSATSSVVNITVASPAVSISSPAADGMVIPLASNTTYLIVACFSPTLDTNDPSLFNLTINGVLQAQSSYIFRPPGVVAGCSEMRSLLYNWNGASPGTNIIQLVYSNSGNGLVLSDTRTVIVPPPPVISGLAGNDRSVVWSSTPGASYTVLATTNLSQPFTAISGIVPANGLSTSYLDVSNSPPAPEKFYEIEIVP